MNTNVIHNWLNAATRKGLGLCIIVIISKLRDFDFFTISLHNLQKYININSLKFMEYSLLRKFTHHTSVLPRQFFAKHLQTSFPCFHL